MSEQVNIEQFNAGNIETKNIEMNKTSSLTRATLGESALGEAARSLSAGAKSADKQKSSTLDSVKSISFLRGKKNSRGDKVAFKEDTTGMMMPQTHKDADSIISEQSLESQETRKLRRHTAVQTTCQHCGENVMTTVFHHKTYFTYLCTFLLLPCCCCFVPHVFKKFKRPVHVCPICSQTVEEVIITPSPTQR